ncbi:PLP-dependent aminotransferase family protein [Niabella aurantiaca]|uniref:MocR-like pyridoxine biosynthesis transcription factor PdxR n=1 Tax=Niabella aurantiaca TaxID=379900 RepID=UPI00037838A8|nr:PLP-dependent aminotransferase family protein [Niabella aurantiaca]
MLRPWNIELHLDERSGKAIYLQIADAIIKDIHWGRLKGGEALPGSRQLAQLLQVNRNTVVEALHVLLIEGWLVSKERKGTFVADQLPRFKKIKSPGRVRATQERRVTGYSIYFDDGHPNGKIAPIAELARSYRQVFHQKAKWQMMSYGNVYGDPAFRAEIAQMLNHQRRMQVAEDHICVTRGSQMAMYLIAQCLLSAGDHVMIENPGYKPAWQAWEHAGATLLPVRVDEEGLLIEDVLAHLRSHKKVKAIYTTPHRQYPTTVTLSLQRRLELIRLSNEYGFVIIEDDYDNEFHFGYRPVHPLSAFPELKHFIYVGTLSKVVAPALRIGYLATKDAALIEKIGTLRKIIDVQGDTIMEQAVLQLIRDGTIKRHIRKAFQYYRSKRDFTASLLSEYLKNKARYPVPEGGLAFWILPHKKINWMQVSKQLRSKGIGITTPDSFSYDEPVNGIRLGYGALSEEQLKDGIKALAAFL